MIAYACANVQRRVECTRARAAVAAAAAALDAGDDENDRAHKVQGRCLYICMRRAKLFLDGILEATTYLYARMARKSSRFFAMPSPSPPAISRLFSPLSLCLSLSAVGILREEHLSS